MRFDETLQLIEALGKLNPDQGLQFLENEQLLYDETSLEYQKCEQLRQTILNNDPIPDCLRTIQKVWNKSAALIMSVDNDYLSAFAFKENSMDYLYQYTELCKGGTE